VESRPESRPQDSLGAWVRASVRRASSIWRGMRTDFGTGMSLACVGIEELDRTREKATRHAEISAVMYAMKIMRSGH